MGAISKDCDPSERPHSEQECKTNIPCPICKFYKLHFRGPESNVIPAVLEAWRSIERSEFSLARFQKHMDCIDRGSRELNGANSLVADADEMTQPLMQPYPPPPISEKLIDQPIPSQFT